MAVPVFSAVTYKDDLTNQHYPTGFYYDEELNNPMTRVTLHANKKYNPSKKNDLEGPWDPITDPDEGTYSDSSLAYSITPIATSIFAEDFSFDIANTYTDFGGDPIGDLWNSQKAMAPYTAMISDALKTISDKTNEWTEKKYKDSGGKERPKWANVLSKVTDLIADNTGKHSHLQARSLHLKGTQFSYYGGSGISFNNMSMKFTLLSDWQDGKFVSIIDKLTKGDFPLMAYVIGDFIPVTEIGQKGEAVHDFLNEYASWQLPPGGFKANLKDIDTINEGTLKLRFGPYFSIENLVISGCSINVSKNMVRNPKPDGGPEIVPMSCDVSLQFKPAARYSKATLDRILSGNTEYVNNVVSKFKPHVS